MKKETQDFLNALTRQELREVNSFAYRKLKILGQMDALTFQPGDKVEWIHEGMVHDGVVEKIRGRVVLVKENDKSIRWKCSPSTLAKA
jgi:plastocyanin